MGTIIVRPARPELIIRDPDDGFSIVPASGKLVVDNSFWQRRIADGDLLVGDAKPRKSNGKEIE